jgi:hypothetical protein
MTKVVIIPTICIRFLQYWILSFVISKRYLCIIRLFLVAEACIDFFVISSERSCKGNLELPQIFIIFAAEEKISNNIFITSVRCNILAFSETPKVASVSNIYTQIFINSIEKSYAIIMDIK